MSGRVLKGYQVPDQFVTSVGIWKGKQISMGYVSESTQLYEKTHHKWVSSSHQSKTKSSHLTVNL